MPDVKLYNQEGQAVGTVALDAKVFGVKPNPGLIAQAVDTQQSNRRVAVAHTKTRGDVRGGGRKPWKQKGTGRARHGSIRSPQWKGGGVIFGPRSIRNFAKKMNSTARRQALRMVLSDKAAHEKLLILEAVAFSAPKTKHFATMLKKFPPAKKSLFVLPTSDQSVIRAGRNIPGVRFLGATSLNVVDILKAQYLVVLKDALPVISATYAK